jgi:hypothetical protein
MTAFSDFCASIAEWENRGDWSPAFVTSLVRMAEAKFNSELRIDRMLATTQNTVTCGCATLPDDWLESDLMLIAGISPTGWVPIRYKPRDEFFRLPATPYSGTYFANYNSTFGSYTIEGRTIYFGGVPDELEGTLYQMNYYQEVPVFSDTVNSWVNDKYPAMYLSAARMHAKLHAVGEEEQAGMMKQLTEDSITKLNNDHMRARASGSRLNRMRVRSFG